MIDCSSSARAAVLVFMDGNSSEDVDNEGCFVVPQYYNKLKVFEYASLRVRLEE